MDGKYNGVEVNVHIVTKGDKEWRLMVQDRHYTDSDTVKARFNSLNPMFEQNNRYFLMVPGTELLRVML